MKAFNEESFAHKGKHYTIPPDGFLPWLHPERHHRGAATGEPGGNLAARGVRQ